MVRVSGFREDVIATLACAEMLSFACLLLWASLSTRGDATVFVLPMIGPMGQMTVMDSPNDEGDEDEDNSGGDGEHAGKDEDEKADHDGECDGVDDDDDVRIGNHVCMSCSCRCHKS